MFAKLATTPRLHFQFKSSIGKQPAYNKLSVQNFSPSFSYQLISKRNFTFQTVANQNAKQNQTRFNNTTNIFPLLNNIISNKRYYAAQRQLEIRKRQRIYFESLGFVVNPVVPKFSVTSFSKMKAFFRFHFTTLYALLWQVKTPLPKFSLKEVKKDAEHIYRTYNNARSNLDLRGLRSVVTQPLYEALQQKIGDKHLPKGVSVKWSCSKIKIRTKVARFLPIDQSNSLLQITFKISTTQSVKVVGKDGEVLKEKNEPTTDIWVIEAPISGDKSEIKFKLLDILTPDGTGILPPSPNQEFLQVEESQ